MHPSNSHPSYAPPPAHPAVYGTAPAAPQTNGSHAGQNVQNVINGLNGSAAPQGMTGTNGTTSNGATSNGTNVRPAPRLADDRGEQNLRPGARPSGMSYKFQRLREKLREAITGGEFAGKLPGERALAKRFHVNAKTLSKALTDLAAEGLLDRSIGRGTYVKGSAPAAIADGRWLVVCDPDKAGDAAACVLEHLRQANPQVEVVTDVSAVRPSYLNQFQAVIDAGSATPETFVRDLVVRNLPVVGVGHEPRTLSTHTVLPDVALGAARIARDLFLAGHRRVAAVEAPGSTALVHALRQAAARYAPDAVVEHASVEDVAALVTGGGHGADGGATALVCDSPRSAERAKDALDRLGLSVPGDVSVAAVGCVCDQPPCTGYFVPCRQVAEAVVSLLRDGPSRPASLWLAGEYADRGTVAPPAGTLEGAVRAREFGTRLGEGEAAELRLEGVLV